MTLLKAVHYPGPDTTPLVIAHGLFGSARNWNVIAKRLSDARPVIAVDMRNHGGSFWDADHGYAALAGDLAAVIDAHGGRADVLGHSMGGKAAMVLALEQPGRVARLIVADIAPVAYGHSQMPVLEAMRAVDLSRVTRRAEADAQLAAHIPEAPLRAFLLQSLSLGDTGPRWLLNLDALGDQMPAIMGFPGGLARSDRPVTVLRGAASDYVGGAHEPALRALFPNARIETVADAGHWLHAENPRGFETALRQALAAPAPR
ncbi:MAG: alpha/beta fold hydrolase [Pseudomonadota bacterium]